jgi:O-antigen/teichoic acid export membrane protein
MLKRAWQTLRQDGLLQAVLKNSSYLFSSNVVSMALSVVQGILAARLLGVGEYGLVAGVVIPFVSNINRLLSFRMSDLVVKYLGQYLVEGKKSRAGAMVKTAASVETATRIIAFLVVLLLAPWAASFLAHEPQAGALISMYGLALLLNFAQETSLGVLQSTRQFRQIAGVNLAQNLLTASLIMGAFLAGGNRMHVLLAYLAGKGLAGLGLSGLAYFQLNRELGHGWFRQSSLSGLPWRDWSRFAVSTNLQATINLFVRDSETLWITALRSTVEAGYFKIALGVINLVLMPIEPFIATTYAEITRSITQQDWMTTRRLLKRVSLISGFWTLASGSGLLLFGYWLIPLMYGVEYRPAYPAMAVLLVGYGFANIFNWNRNLLLALELPALPIKVSGILGVVKTILTLVLVPTWGYILEAVILSGYFVSSIAWIVWRGMVEMKDREKAGHQILAASG